MRNRVVDDRPAGEPVELDRRRKVDRLAQRPADRVADSGAAVQEDRYAELLRDAAAARYVVDRLYLHDAAREEHDVRIAEPDRVDRRLADVAQLLVAHPERIGYTRRQEHQPAHLGGPERDALARQAS